MHSVMKCGKSWKVKFQQRWLDEFSWLSYSGLLRGGICRCCILFTEGPKRGGSHGSLLGVFVLSLYQYPYNKALGKDGILGSHEKNAVHVQAVEQADLFRQNYCNPEARIDACLLRQQDKQANENKEILHHIVMAVEFLANHLEAIEMIELILELWMTTKEISLLLFSSWQRITLSSYYKSTS